MFRNFNYTFFPSNYDTQINVVGDNIARIEVFGTPDADKVITYNM